MVYTYNIFVVSTAITIADIAEACFRLGAGSGDMRNIYTRARYMEVEPRQLEPCQEEIRRRDIPSVTIHNTTVALTNSDLTRILSRHLKGKPVYTFQTFHATGDIDGVVVTTRYGDKISHWMRPLATEIQALLDQNLSLIAYNDGKTTWDLYDVPRDIIIPVDGHTAGNALRRRIRNSTISINSLERYPPA